MAFHDLEKKGRNASVGLMKEEKQYAFLVREVKGINPGTQYVNRLKKRV